jgi:hypothetical protein
MLNEASSSIESKFKLCMNTLVRIVGSFLIIALIGLDLGDNTFNRADVDSSRIVLAIADTVNH